MAVGQTLSYLGQLWSQTAQLPKGKAMRSQSAPTVSGIMNMRAHRAHLQSPE